MMKMKGKTAAVHHDGGNSMMTYVVTELSFYRIGALTPQYRPFPHPLSIVQIHRK